VKKKIKKIGEPEATNITHNFEGCLDYIFYSTPTASSSTPSTPREGWPCVTLLASSLRALLRRQDASVGRAGLPNNDWPSDHLALRCTFTLHQSR
jgi:mRNA deadenylase 3'-5' endonuclease subunit Ccr4